MSGFVYVLSNESMPGMVKIGATENHPSERARQLSSSGVPTPFIVEFAIWVDDHFGFESDVHSNLDHTRVAGNREFFEISVAKAVEEIISAASFPDGTSFVRSDCAFSDPDMMMYADHLGVSVEDVVSVLNNLTVEQIEFIYWMAKKGVAR